MVIQAILHSFVVKGMDFLHHFSSDSVDNGVTGGFEWLNGVKERVGQKPWLHAWGY